MLEKDKMSNERKNERSNAGGRQDVQRKKRVKGQILEEDKMFNERKNERSNAGGRQDVQQKKE